LGVLALASVSIRLLLVGLIALTWSYPVAAAGPAAQQVSYGPGAQQTADLYAGPDGAPVLVWISGGGWVLDTVAATRPFAQHLADRGVTVVVPHYTMGNPAAAADDVVQATAWAAQLPGRGALTIGGHSSGATIAALVVDQGRTVPVDSVLLLSGLYDLPGAVTDGGIAAQLVRRAFGADEAIWAANSPTQYVRAGIPPTWVVHGTADTDVSVSRAQAFANQLEAAGTPVRWTPIQGVGHVDALPALALRPTLGDALLAWLRKAEP
jgi:acetyl esterase/lipase